MKRILLTVLLLALLVGTGHAQFNTINERPDCEINLDTSSTSAATSASFDNRFTGCTTWTLVYSSTGFSAVGGVELDKASDNGGQPNAFAVWTDLPTGTTLPLTSTVGGQATAYRFQPWVQIKSASATGTGRIIVRAIGWRPFRNQDATVVGSSATQFNVQGTLAVGASFTGSFPVVIGGIDSSGNVQVVRCPASAGGCALSTIVNTGTFNGLATSSIGGMPQSGNGGANWLTVFPTWFNGSNGGTAVLDAQFRCPQTAKVNALGASTALLAAGTAAKKVYICTLTLDNNSATASNIKLVEGTGATCGTGTADLSGSWVLGANTLASDYRAFFWGAQSAVQTATAGDSVCLNGSAAGSVEATVTYDVH